MENVGVLIVGRGWKVNRPIGLQFDDNIRKETTVFLEHILRTAANHLAKKAGCRTMSKYIRYAVINQAIRDGYPFQKFTKKFNPFYNKLNYKRLNNAITALK